MSGVPDPSAADAARTPGDGGLRPRGLADDFRELPRTLAAFVVTAFTWLLVDPVRDGRLRLGGRPRPVQVIAVAAIVLAVVVLASTVFARAVRQASDLTVTVRGEVFSFPRPVLGVVVLAVVLSLALFVAGAIHTALWFRLPALVVGGVVLAFVGSTADGAGRHTGLAVGLGASAVIVVLATLRRGRSPVWWEFVIVLTAVVAVFAVTYLEQADVAQAFGVDTAPSVTGVVLRIVRLVAVPAAVVAGLAVAKVALSGMTLVGDFAATRCSQALFLAGALGLLAWRSFTSVRGWLDGAAGTATLGATLGSALALGAVLAVVVVVRRARPSPAASRAPVTAAQRRSDDADPVALPAAVLLSVTVVPLALVLMLQQIGFTIWGDGAVVRALEDAGTFLNDDSTLLVGRVVAGGLLLAGAAVLVRRGHPVLGELAGGAGALLLVTLATAPGAVLDRLTVSATVMDRILVVVIALVTVVWVLRGRFGVARQSAVVLALLVSLLVHERNFVSSPLTAILGSAGIALVLFGFVWNFVADAGAANEDSPRFPRDAKLLLFLAQALLGFTALAWVALARDATGTLDLGNASALGDSVLGTSLLVVVAIAVIGDAIGRREASPGDPDA